ncbi:ABC transporter [Vibrio sp. JCM 19236]|nr:ABC transporter [Vibrio sp. JCM 19236]
MLNNMLAIVRRELLIAFRRRADVFNRCGSLSLSSRYSR